MRKIEKIRTRLIIREGIEDEKHQYAKIEEVVVGCAVKKSTTLFIRVVVIRDQS
jgi:hypothetical protein